MDITDSHGIPIAISLHSATPHEVTLIEETIEKRFVSTLPTCLIGDKAYDSDAHDQILLEKYGIKLIAPHRKNRKKAKTQDSRKLHKAGNYLVASPASCLQPFVVTAPEVMEPSLEP